MKKLKKYQLGREIKLPPYEEMKKPGTNVKLPPYNPKNTLPPPDKNTKPEPKDTTMYKKGGVVKPAMKKQNTSVIKSKKK